MRRIMYNIVVIGCVAATFLTACTKEYDFPDEQAGSGGNSITLNISSGKLSVSRAVTAEGVEVAVSHLDVLIFDNTDAKTKVWSERVQAPADKTGQITLAAKRESFDANENYWVYLIANSTRTEENFRNLADLNALKAMTQEDEDIHMTGIPATETVAFPQIFLMDGIAYPEGQQEPELTSVSPVVLNDGVKKNDTKLAVTLRRAAAKVVVTITKGDDVTFDTEPQSHAAGYYLRNMPYSTSIVSGVDGQAKLKTTDKTSGGYFDWTEDAITVTAYMYAHAWDNASALEQEVRLVMNIPLTYNKDENPQLRPDNYYQVPVCSGKSLNRNTCYKVTAKVNAPGAENPSTPVTLTDVKYSVEDWTVETINVGGENRPAFLTLNQYDLEMRNMENDHTSLIFTSSSEVSVSITKVYYNDKFGQPQTLQKRYPNNPDNNEWGITVTIPPDYPWEDSKEEWHSHGNISVTPDEGLNGKLDVHSDLPENNTIRYIEVTVTNGDGIERTVTIEQYPLTYITNIEGYYSYRDDFVSTASDGTSGVTTWELLAGKKINKGTQYTSAQVPYDKANAWICGCSWNSRNKTWSYGKATTDFFSSKVVKEYDESTGLSNIEYARWTEKRTGRGTSNRPYKYTYNTSTSNVSLNNHRMYHVVITATSSEYTLGIPRITDGKTDPGADNAQLVSPSFMLASQLGAVMAIGDLEGAAEHCERYVEVAKDGTVYDDWRLPTKAEILIIYKYQNESDAMDEVLAGNRYWSASGLVGKPGVNNPNDEAIRCIRDAYDDKK